MRLATADVVHRTEDGWVGDREPLIKIYLDRYRPAQSGLDAWWYALDSLTDQAHRIVAAKGTVAVSADLAADLTVPWRRPSSVIVGAAEPVDLSALDFVPAESKAMATVIVTDDSDLLRRQRWSTACR